MKLFGIFFFACLVNVLNAHPSPLQGFGAGDQTTGSKWPPYENAGKDYWSLKAANIDLREDNVDDGKDIVKKGIEEKPETVLVQSQVEPTGSEPQEVPVPQTLRTFPVYPLNRGSYPFFDRRQLLLRNYYPQYLF